METWDDCLASLHAGASPEEVLPKIRALFASLPSGPPAPEPAANSTPISRLYHTFPEAGDHVFQLPYLRVPFAVWDALAEADEPDERTTLFDTEMTVDVLAHFQPRFVDPPEPRVRGMLENFKIGEEGVEIEESDEEDAVNFDRRSHSQRKPVPRKPYAVADIKRFASELTAFFEYGGQGMDVDEDKDVPIFPPLSMDEWALLFSGLSDSCKLVPPALTKLLLSVNQPALSMIVLQTVFPLLAADGAASDTVESLTHLVSTAACRADLHKRPVAHVRALLDLYRSMNTEVLSALAQLKVVTNMSKGG